VTTFLENRKCHKIWQLSIDQKSGGDCREKVFRWKTRLLLTSDLGNTNVDCRSSMMTLSCLYIAWRHSVTISKSAFLSCTVNMRDVDGNHYMGCEELVNFTLAVPVEWSPCVY